MKTITMKFGGTSVGGPDAITNVIQIIKQELANGNRVVVVVSAMSGITDMLLRSVKAAANNDRWEFTSLSQKMRDKHEEAINLLMRPGAKRDAVLLEINKLLDAQFELCSAIQVLGELTPRVLDAAVSFGERMSSRLVAAALVEHDINAQAFEATKLIVTDETFQAAQPLWEETTERVEARLIPAMDVGVTPIITGFIGATQTGVTTTLGRGGSDYSAAIFAALVDSDEFVVWTDVDGVMTTDPRVDKRARVLPYISYQEVGELAFYGAKVLHPKTVQPILDKEIPIYVRNTFNPTFEGTLIHKEARASKTVIKAVTSVRDVSMLTVSGRGMLGVRGIAGRTFLATARANANILMISQSSSEQSFCFVVKDDNDDEARAAIEDELATEIARKNVDGVDITRDIVIVTVIGAGMRGTPGVSGRVFTALGEDRINVLSIAQGSSECSISFIIAEDDLEHAVKILHNLALEAVPS